MKITLFLSLISISTSLEYYESVLQNQQPIDIQKQLIINQAIRDFPEFPKEQINYMIDQIVKEGTMQQISFGFLRVYFKNFNEKMQNELLDYYAIKADEKYTQIMKSNPEKYGLTISAYKLMVE